eukprot:13088811-Heterocapsa_arctica.AAC.1
MRMQVLSGRAPIPAAPAIPDNRHRRGHDPCGGDVSRSPHPASRAGGPPSLMGNAASFYVPPPRPLRPDYGWAGDPNRTPDFSPATTPTRSLSPVAAVPAFFVPHRHKGHPQGRYQVPPPRPPPARPLPFDQSVIQSAAQPWCAEHQLRSQPGCLQCNRIRDFWRVQIANEFYEATD